MQPEPRGPFSPSRTDSWTPAQVQRVWETYELLAEAGVHVGFYPPDFYQVVLGYVTRMLRGSVRHLDVACGTGTLLAELDRRGYHVVGLDVTPAAIDVLRRRFAHRARVGLQVASLASIPFPDNSFDVVFATEVFEHIPDAPLQQSLTEIVRVLRPGGKLVATTPHAEKITTVVCPQCFGQFHPMGHVRSVHERDAAGMLTFAGLRIRLITRIPSIFIYPQDSFLKRMVKRVARTLFVPLTRRIVGRNLLFVGEKP